jgi:hypothetical protein
MGAFMTENARLKEQAQELRYTELQIEQVEKEFERLKGVRQRLERETLPQLFAEAGIKSIELDDGSRITLSTMAEGSLPKEPAIRAEALAWLVANGYENLIECKVTASWSRGDREKAQAEAQRLQALGSAKVLLDEGIHHSTLGARMRDRVVEGLETPLTLLGVAVFPRARFTKRSGT